MGEVTGEGSGTAPGSSEEPVLGDDVSRSTKNQSRFSDDQFSGVTYV